MIKKALTVLAVTGALVFAGSTAATAYPVAPPPSVGDTTLAPGVPTVITVTGLEEFETVLFSVTDGPGGATLSSLVYTAAAAGVSKPVTNGSASASFSSAAEGTHTISVFDPSGNLITSVSLEVSASFAEGAAAGGTGGTGGSLPATGSDVPLTAIWVGAGALGIGSIAVVVAVARRRAQSSN